MRRRVGIVVNPVAGMGGRVGLKGTDGPEVLARARALGAEPMALPRAAAALGWLRPLADRIEILAPPGARGAAAAEAAGLPARLLDGLPEETGTGADSAAAAARLAEAGAGLILFAGGDGTARDVLGAVGGAVPILGIPTGVKMHSAVFGTSPAAAGQVARAFLEDPAPRTREAEVMDLDEAALRDGRVAARLFGAARVPEARGLVQACKAGARPDDEAALDALARQVARDWPRGRLMVLACGTTTRRVKRALGFEGTLLGVDVALDGRPIALDVDGARLDRLLERAGPGGAGIVAGVTGGQGFLFGRGNQQIGPAALRRVGRQGVVVMAGAGKLARLDPPRLHVDTGDVALDALLAGYWPVHVAPGQRMMMRVAAPPGAPPHGGDGSGA